MDYRDNIKNFLSNEERFVGKINKISNNKHIRTKLIIASVFAIISLIIGLTLAEHNIILVFIMKLFGEHLFAYNIFHLLSFFVGGGLIGILVSYLFEKNMNAFSTDFANKHIKLPVVAEKVSELILVPLIYGMREIISNNSFYKIKDKPNIDIDTETKNYTTILLKRLVYLMSEEYGYSENYAKEKIHEYLTMDIKELYKKVCSLNFYLPVYSNRHMHKYNLTFIKKDFLHNYQDIFGVRGAPALMLYQNQQEIIDNELKKLVNILNGKIKVKNKLTKSVYKKEKFCNVDNEENQLTKNIEDKKEKKLIEIID